MGNDDLLLIRRLHGGALSKNELLAIYEANQHNLRILLNLIQHPSFPQDTALNLINRFNVFDLIRVSANTRANPYVRKKCELEISNRFRRLARGERVSLLKQARFGLLKNFINETDPQIIEVILASPACTEELVLAMINRPADRSGLYRELLKTVWWRRLSVARAILNDVEAPLVMLLQLIPLLPAAELRLLGADENFHESVKTAAQRELSVRCKKNSS